MLEWLQISPEMTLVASATRLFLHEPRALGSDPFRVPMQGQGTPETTARLLEGAIALAARRFRGARTEATSGSSRAPFQLSPARWAFRLAGYFHTTRATRRLLPLIAQRFAAAKRTTLAGWAELKLREEAGHDELALRDLSELGYRAQALTSALVPARALAWVELFESLARAEDPVGSLGYAHALERLALLGGAERVRAIEQALPPGVNATRCLRVHSALGSDAVHVRSNVRTTAALSAAERHAVVRACHAAAVIYFDPAFDDDFSSELEAQVLEFVSTSASPRALSQQPEPIR